MLDIRATIAQKPKKKLYSSMAAMGFIHKEVRGGINHTHSTKEEMVIQIHSILTTYLRDLFYGQAKVNETIQKKLAAKSLMTSPWRSFMPS